MQALLDSDSLATVLCRLNAKNFTGRLRVEHEKSQVVVSFRRGKPVYVEDSARGETLADTLVKKSVITEEQRMQVIDELSMDEVDDVTFCDQALAMGFLSLGQVTSEVTSYIRAKISQLIAWFDCKLELEETDRLEGPEYPQALGPLVYLGVLSFFDDDLVARVVGEIDNPMAARFVSSRQEIGDFFGLEDTDVAILEGLEEGKSVQECFEASHVDPDDGWQVLCMARIAELMELNPVAYAGPTAGARPSSDAASAAAPDVEPPSETKKESPAPSSSKAAPGRARRRAPPSAVRSLQRELERRRPKPPPGGGRDVHLKSILLRKRAAEAGAPQQQSADERFRQARELLRQKRFEQAEDVLRGLRKDDADNDVYRLHYLWAIFRGPKETKSDEIKQLRQAAREFLRDDTYVGFALFVLGHVSMTLGKDSQAEKFFRKAAQIDKGNKDAQRYHKILERRRLVPTEEGPSSTKIFGIEFDKSKRAKD